ncbi:MAG: hypothetical protein M1829_000007 [Trizodia sp. TS-e1964]|nr:MAG: hypothetical protein M1829_000007 [Trizodia sp. TS-e1964]
MPSPAESAEEAAASPPADAQISATQSATYWSQIPATLDGMLGGFARIAPHDEADSRAFIARLLAPRPPSQSPSRAADCGAGIGRVARKVLAPYFAPVDVVEPDARFLETYRRGGQVRGEVVCSRLQEWTPARGAYGLVWNQWCLGHLTEAEVVAYLRRCWAGVGPGGWVVVKENVGREDVYDGVDSSVTRAEQTWARVFERAGLRVVCEAGENWAVELGLFPVRMWALVEEEGA